MQACLSLACEAELRTHHTTVECSPSLVHVNHCPVHLYTVFQEHNAISPFSHAHSHVAIVFHLLTVQCPQCSR